MVQKTIGGSRHPSPQSRALGLPQRVAHLARTHTETGSVYQKAMTSYDNHSQRAGMGCAITRVTRNSDFSCEADREKQ